MQERQLSGQFHPEAGHAGYNVNYKRLREDTHTIESDLSIHNFQFADQCRLLTIDLHASIKLGELNI